VIVDVNAFLGLWPFRHLWHSGIDGLERLMGRSGVSHALVSPFESLFYRDNVAANGFIRELGGSKSLCPIAAINPSLPDVGDFLSEMDGLRAIKGLKLHPDYHCYDLNGDSAKAAFDFAEERGLPVIIPLRIQDERLHPKFALVPPTPVKALIEVAKLYPKVNVIACNARSDELGDVLGDGSPNLHAVVSWVQEEGFVASAVRDHGCGRLMWGSNMPLQYPEPTLEQIGKADVGPREKEGILAGNAVEVFNIIFREPDAGPLR